MRTVLRCPHCERAAPFDQLVVAPLPDPGDPPWVFDHKEYDVYLDPPTAEQRIPTIKCLLKNFRVDLRVCVELCRYARDLPPWIIEHRIDAYREEELRELADDPNISIRIEEVTYD